MDTFLIILLFFLVGVVLPAGISFLFYFIPKKLGYPRLGKWLSGLYIFLISLLILFIVFEDQLFFKKDARRLLGEQGIELHDDFEILHNRTMGGIGEYFHFFTLKISAEDKQHLIRQFTSAENFRACNEKAVPLLKAEFNPYEDPRRTKHYETKQEYIMEYFTPLEKGYAPIFRRVLLPKSGNTLLFEEMDD